MSGRLTPVLTARTCSVVLLAFLIYSLINEALSQHLLIMHIAKIIHLKRELKRVFIFVGGIGSMLSLIS